MIVFDDININLEKPTPENMHRLRAYLSETMDKLNMLAEEVEKLKKEREN